MSGNQHVRSRTGRRIRVAVTLIGLVVVGLVPMAPANAATTITLSRGTVIGGESITVSGSLGQRKARPVVLVRKSGTSWVKVVARKSTTAGRFKFTYKPPTKSGSKTVIRVIAPKVRISGRTYSQITTASRTVLTVAQGATISVPTTKHENESFAIAGTFSPARSGRSVAVQKLTATGWVSFGSPSKQNSVGAVSVPMTLPIRGSYDFRLLALASSGAPAVASVKQSIEITASLNAPPTPTGLVVTPGNGKADLSWNAVVADDLAGYLVYRRTSSGELWTKITTNPVQGTSYTATPLTNGFAFQFSVVAIDTDGNESDRSATVTATPADHEAPPMPSGVTAQAGNASAEVSWNAVSASDLAGYLVWSGPTASGPWTQLTANPVNVVTYPATNLTNGDDYFFAVESVDTSPAANKSAKGVTPTSVKPQDVPPDAPTIVGATGHNASAQVSWSAVSGPGISYKVYYRETASVTWLLATPSPITATSFLVPNLTNDTSYSFAVTAVNATSESAKSSVATATPAAGAFTWTAVTSGREHSCGRRSDSTLWCWGYNSDGQLGSNASITSPSPTQVGSDSGWATVEAGDDSTCGVRTNGTLWCWGSNKYGQLGTGTNSGTDVANPAPLQVGSTTTWTKVSVGRRFACGLQSSGTVWCWGFNSDGQLGRAVGGDPLAPNPTPVQVGSVTTWTSLSLGTDHACAVRTDGTLWCWGSNISGQLGNGVHVEDGLPTPTPTQVGSGTAWTSVSAGEYHACGVQTGGTAWCWGSNVNGELGRAANAVANTTPTQVSGTAGWSQISAGGDQTCAVKAVGTAWCWGRNEYGQLGKAANLTANPTPAQVGSATTWASIESGYQHTGARTTTGNILAWGRNSFGQLGDPSTVNPDNANPTPALVPIP